MDPAYYVAAGSLKARAYQLDTVANNLANSQTVGYKAERSFFTVFNKAVHEGRGLPLSPFVNDGTIHPMRDISFAQGPTKYTERSLDFAIEGNAFFAIQNQDAISVTRDGRFILGTDGSLVNLNGMPLLGINGPIMLDPNGGMPFLAKDGSLYQGDVFVDQLDLRAYEDTRPLARLGAGLFDPAAAQEAPVVANVAQGYLEQSSVDLPSAMVEMIRLHRLFEITQKVASAITNDLDAKSLTISSGQ